MYYKYDFKPKLITRISSVSRCNMKRGFVQPAHAHAYYGHEIIYLDYGRMVLTIDGRDLQLNTGEIFFIRGGWHHTFTGRNEVPFDYLNIMFRGKIPDELFGKPMSIDKKMRDILLQLKHEHEFQEKHYLEMFGCLLNELIIYLLRQLDAQNGEKTPLLLSNRIYYESEKVDKAVAFIRENYNTPLQVSDVAKVIQISPSHLRLLLRKNTGKNFTTILHGFRIEAAKHMIREEGYSFSEIAAKIGFESPTFFFKLFKRYTGMTPKEFAKGLG